MDNQPSSASETGLSEDDKEKVQAQIDQRLADGEDPLLPSGTQRNYRRRGGQPKPKPPDLERAIQLNEEEIALLEAFRAKRKRIDPETMKREWERQRQNELVIGGNVLPMEPPKGWLPDIP